MVNLWGIIPIVIGLLIIRFFPGITTHQPKDMTLTGLWIGIILFLVGIALLVFG
jgi:hypothetical protein